MDFKHVTEQVILFFQQLSQDVGTGNMNHDLIVVALGFALIVLIVVFLALRKSGSEVLEGGFESMRGMNGRLEKLEVTLNTLKTEVLRFQHLLNADLNLIKQDLGDIRSSLGAPNSERILPQETFEQEGFEEEELKKKVMN